MLTLTRGINEQLIIGDGPNAVVVTVKNIIGGKVCLGFEADRSIPIWRAELQPRAPRVGDEEAT